MEYLTLKATRGIDFIEKVANLSIFDLQDGPTNYLCREENWDASPMAWTLIRDIARTLSPDRPIIFLARLAGCPRPTAKSWATGHRRPPISVLKLLRELVQGRRTGLEGELDYEIRRREYEPKHRTGFNLIRERDGPCSIPRDGRNRRGRPRRVVATAQ
jgi:hypothetical protein